MHLTPQEKDKLLIVTAALLAERRLQRGVKLNHPEAVAWLSFQVLEGVPELVDEVQIEAVFPDGTKLVTLHDPIR
ncbi:MAG: urease subunit gamma [Cyanobacteriota bacterium]